MSQKSLTGEMAWMKYAHICITFQAAGIGFNPKVVNNTVGDSVIRVVEEIVPHKSNIDQEQSFAQPNAADFVLHYIEYGLNIDRSRRNVVNISGPSGKILKMHRHRQYEICVTMTSKRSIDPYCEILDQVDSNLTNVFDLHGLQFAASTDHYSFTGKLTAFDAPHLDTTYVTGSACRMQTYSVCLLQLNDQGSCADANTCNIIVKTMTDEESAVKKISVVPASVSVQKPEVNIRGFHHDDIGHRAMLVMHDKNNVLLSREDVILSASHDLLLPETPGMYFLQVVTEKYRYGALIAIQ